MQPKFQMLVPRIAVLAASLLYLANATEAKAGQVNLTRSGPYVAVVGPQAPPLPAVPYSVSRNEIDNSPDAAINSNQNFCTEMADAEIISTLAEVDTRDVLSQAESVVVRGTTLLSAHVLLRI